MIMTAYLTAGEAYLSLVATETHNLILNFYLLHNQVDKQKFFLES